MKIFNNGKRIGRDYLGRYSKGHVTTQGIIIAALVAIVGIGSYLTGAAAAEPVMFERAQEEFKAQEAAKITKLQDEVLNTLSACETRGVTEKDATIILDTNNKMSIGRYQFQITTVQYYSKKLRGLELTRVEAITLSTSQEQATELAREIIFEVQGGIYNWANCARKHSLVSQVEFIKKLMQ